MKNKDPEWLAELFELFMDEENAEAAFLIMKGMRAANLKHQYLMNEQIALGNLLAQQHIAEDDTRNPYLIINDYTKNEKWWGWMRKEYLSVWERHQAGE
jgi:hypothetical protein